MYDRDFQENDADLIRESVLGYHVGRRGSLSARPVRAGRVKIPPDSRKDIWPPRPGGAWIYSCQHTTNGILGRGAGTEVQRFER
jgi:hypothetical protein